MTNLLDVPRSTFVDAKWNELNEKVWETFAEVVHALDNGGRFKTTLTYRDAETPQRNFTWADGAVEENGTNFYGDPRNLTLTLRAQY